MNMVVGGLRWERAPPIVVRSAFTRTEVPFQTLGILGQDTIKIYEQMLDSNMQHLDCRGRNHVKICQKEVLERAVLKIF